MSKFGKPELATLKALSLEVPPHEHGLHRNELPFDYPDDLKEEVLRRVSARNWSCYPSARPVELTETLAQHLGVTPDMILVGNGSSDLIYTILAATVGRGDRVVLQAPSFIRYRILSQVMGASIHTVQAYAENDFVLPVDEVIDTAQRLEAQAVLLCSPNNPTGVGLPVEKIRRIAAETDGLVLVDAAYEEFCAQDTRSLPLEFENVIVLRTFSKAMSMGGLRVGYAIMAPAMAAEIEKAKLQFVPNLLGEAAAVVALENHQRFDAMVKTIKRERARIYPALASMPGFYVYPSMGNFFLVRTTQPSEQLHDYLLAEHGILTMNLGHAPLLQNHLRITLGRPEQNDLLLDALQQWTETHSQPAEKVFSA